MTDKKFDVVVIGAGPNGLELAAYLSGTGLKVAVLERRVEIGGGLAAEQVTLPGYIHNTHAIYMMMVDYAPVYTDLKLEERYGLKHIYPSLQFVLPLSDGKSVCLYSDPEKTCNSIAKFSKHDADAYRELYHRCRRAVDQFIAPATFVPPVPTLDQVIKLQQTDLGREISKYAEKTPKDIIDEYFENEHVKALMLYLATQWGLGYDQAGMGYLVFLYLDRATSYRLVVGTSHMVTQALHKAVYSNGGVIYNSQRIKRIIIEHGKAKGVELDDGTKIYADKAVVSTIDPPQTFLKLVGKENLQEEFTEKVENWMWEKHSLAGLHLALEEAPDFTAAATEPEINKAFVYVLGYETDEDLIEDYEAIGRDELREKSCFNCCIPSIHDPSQAPPGRHTGFLSRLAPYRLADGGPEKWYSIKFKEEIYQQYLITLQKYAPNMTEDKVLWHSMSTPIDIENKFIDMGKGSIKQGLYHPLQMGYMRPNEDCSLYRTPIESLYVAGASCYPGGCVIWGPGYVAANVIAEDLGVEKWWSEPEIVTRARKEGLI
jgi:phytoene dehydrogenase-like protein